MIEQRHNKKSIIAYQFIEQKQSIDNLVDDMNLTSFLHINFAYSFEITTNDTIYQFILENEHPYDIHVIIEDPPEDDGANIIVNDMVLEICYRKVMNETAELSV
jgi:hypothetical protein